jgi:small GTP-binding protein
LPPTIFKYSHDDELGVVVRFNKKVCLLGDEGVGKTSLIKRFVYNQFDDSYIRTIGTKISKKDILLQGKDGKPVQLFLMVWDIIGHKSSKKVPATYYAGVEGMIVVFDLTRSETFNDLDFWVNSIMAEKSYAPVVVILGNKSDLREQQKVTEDELQKMAAKLNAMYFLTSAKTGQNVESAFMKLGSELIARHTGPGWSWV